jgi:hypothetical protein
VKVDNAQPTYEEGDLALFETGAIVFHLAERHAGLLPDDATLEVGMRAQSVYCPRSGRNEKELSLKDRSKGGPK